MAHPGQRIGTDDDGGLIMSARLIQTDAELVDYASKFRASLLAGEPSVQMCVVTAAPLEAALHRLGVGCTLACADGHFFLRLDDGRVLDATSDQFNDGSQIAYPEVYLGAPLIIHANAEPVKNQLWREFVDELARIIPGLPAHEVGLTVRTVYSVLPAVTLDSRHRQSSLRSVISRYPTS